MELMSTSLKTVDFIPDNVATWMFHCHVNNRISFVIMSLQSDLFFSFFQNLKTPPLHLDIISKSLKV